jgi:hypothetical protein
MNDELIYNWIRQVTASQKTVIKANQNGPRPPETFITWQIISLQPSDFSLLTETENGFDLEATDTRRYNVGVDVNVYGPDGVSILAALTQSNTDPDAREILSAQSTTLLGAGVIQDLAFLGDTNYEPRFQVEFQFNTFIESSRIQTNWIWDDYSISGTLDGDTITIEP